MVNIKNLYVQNIQILELFFVKLYFNLKAEASRTYLRYLWWILEPSILVFTFYIVFGIFFANGSDNFLIMLLCGNIPYFWFSKSISNSTHAITDSSALISQTTAPASLFPLLSVSQDFVKQLVVFICLFFFLLLYGVTPSFIWFSLFVVIFVQFLFIIAMAYIVAGITPYFPDFRYLVDTGLLILMFASGVFFRYQDVVAEEFQYLFLLNPMANLIENYRRVILNDTLPNWLSLFSMGMGSSVLIIISLYWYKQNAANYARRV